MSDLYYLSDDQRAIRDLAREIARERIAPLAAHVDETGEYPHEQLKLLGQQGLMGLHIPEAYGGTASGSLAFCLACEEVAWACASTATILLVQNLGGYPLIFAGSEEQKRRYLPKLASGEMTAAFSLSEPGAGSDAAAMTCRAVRKGDRYVLNGSKMWVTNGSHAGIITVFVTTEPGKRANGVTALLVEPVSGLHGGKPERKLGIHGSPTVALHFTDCEVPVENRSARKGTASRPRCGPSSSRAPPSARGRSALPRPRSTPRWPTPRSGAPSIGPSPPSRASSSCWPTWRSRCTLRGSSSTTPPR